MLVTTRTYKVLPRLEGGLRGPVNAKFVAFCVWDAAAYLMLFAGSAAAWEVRGAAAGAEVARRWAPALERLKSDSRHWAGDFGFGDGEQSESDGELSE